MAIEVTGTNSNGYSSVEVSVGPAGWTHKKDKIGLIPSPIGQLDVVLSGCFDPANRKCYSGSGPTATDFVSGINYTITGNSNNDTIYKSDNLGIIEVTGNGYIKANGSYSPNDTPGIGGSNTIEMWFWPSTGPAEEQAIFQLRKNNNGSYENGYTVVRRAIGNNRSINIYKYTNDGNYFVTVASISNAIFLDTWNQIIIYDFRLDPGSRFRLFRLGIKSAYHEYISNLLSVSFEDGSNQEPNGYDDFAPRELTICKAEGITGTFKGKIGCTKIYQGIVFSLNADPEIDPENINGFQESWKRIYQCLAPRYDQYD
jgi:hypothetical protein